MTSVIYVKDTRYIGVHRHGYLELSDILFPSEKRVGGYCEKRDTKFGSDRRVPGR